jgi:4,5-DOPA dioxygenase extradiol
VATDTEWGLDHGAWVVLKRMFPAATIPVYQLSIDFSQPHSFHYEVGKELAALRERGVLIIGSGNIVHNLGRIHPNPSAPPYDWAVEFDAQVKQLVLDHDDSKLIEYEKLGHAANLAVPTPDHYWPLLYTLGVRGHDEKVTFFAEGIAHGSIAMRGIVFG